MSEFSNLGIFEKIRAGKTIRVCAFGSSNTERFDTGMHWFDYVELGFKNIFGGSVGQFINTGISGNTSSQMLERFERDVAPYSPDLTIVTCGGNDSNPSRNISESLFRENLRRLVGKLRDLGGEVVFQTYYACDLERLDPAYAGAIPRYMQIIREAAAELDCRINDNYSRWERLRLSAPDLYRLLMRDNMHVNLYGNMVIGLDLMRKFGFKLADDKCDFCRTGLIARYAMDLLEERER